MKNLLVLSMLLSPLAFAGDKIPAQYEVPVPAELAAFATYDLEGLEVQSESGEVSLRYQLPLALTGVEQKVKLSGRVESDGVMRLSDENGSTMECREVNAQETCRVVYKGVRQDLGLVKIHLTSLALAPDELEGKFAVAEFFGRAGGDMEGIVRYRRNYGPRALLSH